jgi:outer membrane receptor for monomeric catechols
VTRVRVVSGRTYVPARRPPQLDITCKARQCELFSRVKAWQTMKARNFIVVVALLCASYPLLATCQAEEETSKAASSPKAAVVSQTGTSQTVKTLKPGTAVAQQTKPTMLTGSYIPAKIKRDGRITDGMYDVTVIDRDTIERSGAASLAQVLAREPGLTIRHH